MESASEDIYFQKLEELIQDDDKIVTIPSLAKILKIPVQDSQYLLSKYVKDQRKLEPNTLCVTYVLSGSLNDKENAVIISKEDNLKDKRKCFAAIKSEVLFSVQKCKQIDFTVLSLVHDVMQASEAPLLGSIVSKNCVKRLLKIKKLPPPQPSTIKGKSSIFLTKTDSSSKEVSTSKSESKPKQNGIANIFSKASTQTSKEKEVIDKVRQTSTTIKSKGISAFLSKSSSIKSENGVKTECSKISDNMPNPLEELMDVDFHEFDEELENTLKKEKDKIKVEDKIKTEVKKDKTKNVKKTEGKGSKSKRSREKSEEKMIKKRRRIVEENDSESDDLFENDDDENINIVEKSDDEPELEQAPSPVEKKPLCPKNKIKKPIENTYMDEEGYIVTKTEYVYESAPEDDVVEIKQEEKQKKEKKSSAFAKNDISPHTISKGKKGKKNSMQNQPTLMNFFKKK